MTPGPLTTATRVLKLALGDDVRTRDLPFDEVLDEVVSGRAEAGLLIHEGQLTFAEHGLRKLLDLGVWWGDETGLPLPLGSGRGAPRRRPARRTSRPSLREAIDVGLANREEAMALRDGVRPRHRRGDGRRVRRDVRERADARHGHARPRGGRAAARLRAGVRR